MWYIFGWLLFVFCGDCASRVCLRFRGVDYVSACDVFSFCILRWRRGVIDFDFFVVVCCCVVVFLSVCVFSLAVAMVAVWLFVLVKMMKSFGRGGVVVLELGRPREVGGFYGIIRVLILIACVVCLV